MDRRRAAGALLALAVCIASSEAAPTVSNHTGLDLYDAATEGCYYNFQHYGEGDRIMTNEPCLNCTCHNRMLMCYLRVCPFTKPIGQDCTVEKRADQCCPIVTCPDVPVDLLTSTSTTSPAEYGATGVGKLDRYGCSINGKYFPEGAKVPPTPNKPCEHCYCIRNMTTCVMQECTLHVDGCTPIYHKDVCCPVRYSCDHPEDEMLLLDDMTTTVRPTPGFLLTTTTVSPVTQMTQDCIHEDQIVPDGALIKTEKACEHCYCMKGDIVCVVQECGTPMENEGKNCTSQPPREGQCCPDTYICEGDEIPPDVPSDFTTHYSELEELTTSSPPRRVGVEGSGYRNEPDEPFTEMSPLETEMEGSGFEDTTSPILSVSDEHATKTQDDTESSTHKIIISDSETSEKQESATELSISSSDESTHKKLDNEFESTTLPSTDVAIEGSSEISGVETAYTDLPGSSVFEEDTPKKHEYETTTQSGFDISHVDTTQKDSEHTIEYEKENENQEGDTQQTTTPLISATDSDSSVKHETDSESTTYQNIDVTDRDTKDTQENEVEHATEPITSDTDTASESTTHSNINVTDRDTTDTQENEVVHATEPSKSDIDTTNKHKIENEHTTSRSEDVTGEVTTQKENIDKELTKTPSIDIADLEESTGEYKLTTLPSLDVSDQDMTSQESYGTTLSSAISDIMTTGRQENEYDQTTLSYDQSSEKVTSGKVEAMNDLTTTPKIDSQSTTPPLSVTVMDISEKLSPEQEIETTDKAIIDKSSTVEPQSVEDIEKTTEPDKGLNTVPSGISDEDLPGISTDKIFDTTEIKSTTAAAISASNEYEQKEKETTHPDKTITESDLVSTTETVLKVEEMATHKQPEPEQPSTQSSEQPIEETTTFAEHITTELHISDQNEIGDTTRKTIPKENEYTTSEISQSVTESLLEATKSISDVTTDSTTERKESVFEPTTDKMFITETTSIDSHENEIDDYARIPGEGDCLLNGVTYRNNSEVPKTNNCHTGCRCASSIIKCDPIICSSPPEYMDNCQPVFDSPDSCCPTYICHTGETIPPQPDSHMSATERPGTPSTIECHGDQCEGKDKESPASSDKPVVEDCGSTSCGEDISVNIPSSNKTIECSGENCPPASEICSNGDCQVTHPETPCEGENCVIEPIITPVKDVPLCTDAENCQQISPCVGESCKKTDCTAEDCKTSVTSATVDNKPEICDNNECKKQDSEQTIPCAGDTCRRKDASELENKLPDKCTGSECTQTEISTSTESVIQVKPETITESIQDETHTKIPEKSDITLTDQDTQTKSPDSSTTIKMESPEQSTAKQELLDEMPSSETSTASVSSIANESITKEYTPMTEVPEDNIAPTVSTVVSDSVTTSAETFVTEGPLVDSTSEVLEIKGTDITDTTKAEGYDSETSTTTLVTESKDATKEEESVYTTSIPKDIESDTKSQQTNTETPDVFTTSLAEEQAMTTQKSYPEDSATERPNLIDIKDFSTISPKEPISEVLGKDKTEHVSTETQISEEITTQAPTKEIDQLSDTMTSLPEEQMVEKTTEVVSNAEINPEMPLSSAIPSEISNDVTTEVSDTATSDIAEIDEASHKTTQSVDITMHSEPITETSKDQTLKEQQITSEKPMIPEEQHKDKIDISSPTTEATVPETSKGETVSEEAIETTEKIPHTLDDKSPITDSEMAVTTEKLETTDQPQSSVSMAEDVSTLHIEPIVTEHAITLTPELTDSSESDIHITKQDEFIGETTQSTEEQETTGKPLHSVPDTTTSPEQEISEHEKLTTSKISEITEMPIDTSHIDDVSPTEAQVIEKEIMKGVDESSTPVYEHVGTKQPEEVTELAITDIAGTEKTTQAQDTGMFDKGSTVFETDVTKQQETSQTPVIDSKEESQITEKILTEKDTTTAPEIIIKPMDEIEMSTYSSDIITEEKTERAPDESTEKLEHISDYPLSSTQDLATNTQEPIQDTVTEKVDKKVPVTEVLDLEAVTEKEMEPTEREISEATETPEKILTTQGIHGLSSEGTHGLTDKTEAQDGTTKPFSDYETPSTVIPVIVTEENDMISTETSEVVKDQDYTKTPLSVTTSSQEIFTQQDVTTEPEKVEVTEQPVTKEDEEILHSTHIPESHIKVSDQPGMKEDEEISHSTHIPESHIKVTEQPVTKEDEQSIFSTHIPESDIKVSPQEVTEIDTSTISQNADNITPTKESQTPHDVLTELPQETSTGLPQATDKETIIEVPTLSPDDITKISDIDLTEESLGVTSQSLPEITTSHVLDEKTESASGATSKYQEMTTESTLSLATSPSQDSSTEVQNISDTDLHETSTVHGAKEPELITEIALDASTTLAAEKLSDDKITQSAQDLTTEITEAAITDFDVTEVPQKQDTSIPQVTFSDTTLPKEPQMASTKLPFVTETDSLYEKTTEILQDTTKAPLETFTHETGTTSPTPTLEEDSSKSSNEEEQSVTEPKHEPTETTPYVVELEEHTHKPVEETSTILPTEYEIPTEHSQSVTEMKIEQPTTTYISVHEVSTTPAVEETYAMTTLTPISDDKQTPQVTTETSEAIPEKEETIEPTTTKPREEVSYPYVQEQTTLEVEIPVQTEKSTIPEKAPEIESTHKPGSLQEEIPVVTDKSTTTKLDEDITTLSSVPKPSEKPTDVLPSIVPSETPKPISNEVQPTDDIPDDDQFPPSEGTSGYGQEPDYVEEDQAFGPGTCRYGGKVYVSAQQIPRDDPCDFCFCFRSDIICLQQSCPPPIHGCHEEPIQGFCCPRYECPVAMATTLNVTTTTTTTTTTLPPHFLPHAYKGAAQRKGCQIKGHIYKVGEVVRASSGPCLHCTCGGDGQMKCDPKACTPEPMLRQMIAAAVSAKRRR